jgi:hypothetical protein
MSPLQGFAVYTDFAKYFRTPGKLNRPDQIGAVNSKNAMKEILKKELL